MKITFKNGKEATNVYGVYLAGSKCFFEDANGNRTTFDISEVEAIREESK